MAKKYVPEGVYLACDSGTSPSDFRITNHKNTSIYGSPMATEKDLIPYFNIKPMGLCIKKYFQACIPAVTKWDKPVEGVKINGSRLLLEDSTCKCLLGGNISIHFTRESAVSVSIGEGKMPSEYIKDGFDWVFDKMEERRAERDSSLPGWMQGVAHVGDWFDDLGVGLVEGTVNSVVGMGELVYQVGQDPVGMAEALGGMVQSGYESTKDALGDAKEWASDMDNWEDAATNTWDWVSERDNWEDAASSAWEGAKNAAGWVADNPRKIGNVAGEFVPDAAAAALTGGGSLAGTAGRKALKEGGEEILEEVAEKAVKETVEEAGEKAAKEGGEEAVEAGARKTGKELLEELAEEGGGEIPKVVNWTTKQKGNFGEIAAHQNMTSEALSNQGYNLSRIGDGPPTGLDDKIKKGIDGIYENSTPPPKFIIDEAKFGSSSLSKLTDGTKQMSDEWIKGKRKTC
ncbi:MAG: PAAR-like protein [Chitinophagales bacterium]